VGDFEYVDVPAMLGELGGNRFEIILRSLSASSDLDVISACDSVRTQGFINYFGLQRFGKGGSKSHEIGREILKSNWENCVRMLFTSKSDDRVNIAQAKVLFHEQKYQLAIGLLPDQMHAEKGVLQCLQTHPADWLRAYQSIPKNARLICMHAYQSCLWNKAVSRRLSLHGLRCIEGDLVVITSAASGSDSASAKDNSFQRCSGNAKPEVRALTSEDVSSQSFSIRDVVLPLLGSDSVLPPNAIGDYYLELLAADGLSMDMFRSCDAAYREKGAYRRMLQCPTDFVYKLIPYDDIDAELNDTELTAFRKKACVKLSGDDGDVPGGTSHAQSVADDLVLPQEVDPTTVPAAATSSTFRDARHKALQLQFTLPPGTYGKVLK
jgi:tRNA pseudouridine13 synthase